MYDYAQYERHGILPLGFNMATGDISGWTGSRFERPNEQTPQMPSAPARRQDHRSERSASVGGSTHNRRHSASTFTHRPAPNLFPNQPLPATAFDPAYDGANTYGNPRGQYPDGNAYVNNYRDAQPGVIRDTATQSHMARPNKLGQIPVWPPSSEFPNTIRPSDLTGPPFNTNASSGFNAQRRRKRAAEEARQRDAVRIPGNTYGLSPDDDPFAAAAIQPSSAANASSSGNAQRGRTENEARRRAARNPGNVFGFDPDEDADADAN
ncbi:hypothetical protein J4E91_010903 [Alternaria rosae]|nr:hypothetical protein J4E91_010903 [Alternaria rosae]